MTPPTPLLPTATDGSGVDCLLLDPLNLKTTMIYTHVEQAARKTTSPLDYLDFD